MPDDHQSALRTHVLDLLRSGNSHAGFNAAVADFPERQRGIKPAGSPHSAWQLVEHLRIAQLDILQFSRDARHASPKFPDGYWPQTEAPPNERAWETTIANFHRDAQDFCDMVADPYRDLLVPLKNAPDGQTLLREALVLADHNAYHIGQIILIRKMLHEWSLS